MPRHLFFYLYLFFELLLKAALSFGSFVWEECFLLFLHIVKIHSNMREMNASNFMLKGL